MILLIFSAAFRPGAAAEATVIDPHHGNNEINSFLIKPPWPRPFSSPALIPEVLSWGVKYMISLK